MDTQIPGHVKLLSDVKPGSVFMIGGDTKLLCIKSFLRIGEETHNSFVSLTPHPAYDGRIGSFDIAREKDQPVYEVIGASFCTPLDPNKIDLEDYRYSSGKAYIFGNTLFLGIRHHTGDAMLLNIESGELFSKPPEQHCAKIGSWKIIQSVNDGCIELASWPPPKEDDADNAK